MNNRNNRGCGAFEKVHAIKLFLIFFFCHLSLHTKFYLFFFSNSTISPHQFFQGVNLFTDWALLFADDFEQMQMLAKLVWGRIRVVSAIRGYKL